MPKEETVHQLGCGTLIVIALIVAFLGNRGMTQIRTEVKNVKRDVERLEDTVRDLERAVKALTAEVRKR